MKSAFASFVTFFFAQMISVTVHSHALAQDFEPVDPAQVSQSLRRAIEEGSIQRLPEGLVLTVPPAEYLAGTGLDASPMSVCFYIIPFCLSNEGVLVQISPGREFDAEGYLSRVGEITLNDALSNGVLVNPQFPGGLAAPNAGRPAFQ